MFRLSSSVSLHGQRSVSFLAQVKGRQDLVRSANNLANRFLENKTFDILM